MTDSNLGPNFSDSHKKETDAGDASSISNMKRSRGSVNRLDFAEGASAKQAAVGENITQVYVEGEQAYDVRSLPNPYLGLLPFTYSDREKYAGRKTLIAGTVAQMTNASAPIVLLFITGASGSGKSSFAQAGLLPALKAHYAALDVRLAVLRPGREPLGMLADGLWRQAGMPLLDPASLTPTLFSDYLCKNTASQQINIIIIDQFEELYTQSVAPARELCYQILSQLPSFVNSHTFVIATMRSDYLPELFNQPELYDIAKRGVELRVMSGTELRDAIQQPLRAAYPNGEIRFEQGLVDRLARDAGANAAYLPLLQVTLQEIWRKGSLKLDSYTNLSDALKERANQVLAYRDFDTAIPQDERPQQEQVELLDLLLDLVDVSLDDDARRDVRRQRTKAELERGNRKRSDSIQVLSNARLLSVEREANDSQIAKVDLIHESLLLNWDRLRAAIADRREELKQRSRFEQNLDRWQDKQRGTKYLLIGIGLEEARELKARNDVIFAEPAAVEFLDSSIAQYEALQQKELEQARHLADEQRQRAEAEERARRVAEERAQSQAEARAQVEKVAATEKRRVQTLRVAAVGLGILLLIALMASYLALEQQRQAEHARDLAQTSDLIGTAELVREANPDLSILLAARALEQAETLLDKNVLFRAEDSLHDALAQLHPAVFFKGHTDRIFSARFSPDGKQLVTASEDTTARIWDRESGKEIRKLTGHIAAVQSAEYSPDGEWIVTAGRDGRVLLWDARDGQMIRELINLGKQLPVYRAAFNPSGTMVATANQDGTVSLIDLTTDQVKTITCINSFANNERFELTSNEELGNSVPCHLARVNDVRFSPQNDKLLITASDDQTAVIWNLTNQTRITLKGHLGEVMSAVFSPTGEYVLTSSYDQTARLWDVKTGRSVRFYRGHSDRLFSANFSPSGGQIISSSADGTARISDRDSTKLLAVIKGHTQPIFSGVFAPDGNAVATTSYDGLARLWLPDASGYEKKVLRTESKRPEELFEAVFSQDNRYVTALAFDGKARIWDTQTGNMELLQLAQGLWNSGSAFTPDGELLAIVIPPNSIQLWNLATRERVATQDISAASNITTLEFSPTGKSLFMGDDTGKVWKLDPSNLAAADLLLDTGAPVTSMASDNQAKYLATTFLNDPLSRIYVWDLGIGAPRATILEGHSDSIVSLAFNRTGTRLVSASRDRTARIWDVTPGKPPLVLLGHSNLLNSATFSGDGEFILSAADDQSAKIWDAQTGLEVFSLRGHTGLVRSAFYSQDGTQIATVSDDGSVRIFFTRPTDLIQAAQTRVPRALTCEEEYLYLHSNPCETPTPSPTR